ncbi:MAG: hypothetical protein ABI592_11070 [Acidobacteriota bacterium]
MKRLAACLAVSLLAAAAAAQIGLPEDRFPPKGRYNNSVHRYFPDLDGRLNAVRYGRWRALETAWMSGINRTLDRDFSAYLRGLLADPPRFSPEAERVAPRFAREAAPLFRALRWGQVFEQEVVDVLASPDAEPSVSAARLERALDLYRREPWALTAPPDARSNQAAVAAAPVSARILSSGTRLFAAAAEDLAAADFGQQRWRVRDTVAEFDRSYASEKPPPDSTYWAGARTVTGKYPGVGEHLDRIARFRGEIFAALVPGGETEDARRQRHDRVCAVARRYGIPTKGIREQ